MSVPLHIRNQSTDLYGQALSAIWGLYTRRVHDPSYALWKDPDAWEIILRDPKARQGIDQRLTDVAGSSWRISPASETWQDEQLAKVIEDAFKEIRHFRDARRRLAQAIFRGQSYERIRGRRKTMSLAEMPAQNWWVPTHLQNIDPRRFAIKANKQQLPNGESVTTSELVIYDLDKWGMAPVPGVGLTQYTKLRHPEELIRVVYDDEEARLGFGRGILDSLYFHVWAKQIVLKEGLQGLERWSQGIVTMQIDEDRTASTGKTNEDFRDETLDAIKEMRSRHQFVYGKNEKLEVVETSGQGHQIVVSFLNYIDDTILGLTTGAVLPSGGGKDKGSLARAEVEQDTQESRIQYDREKIDEDITTEAIGLFMKLNTPQLAAIGLANARRPMFATGEEKKESSQERIERLQKTSEILEVPEEWMREQLDVPSIKPGEPTVGGRPAPALNPFGQPSALPFKERGKGDADNMCFCVGSGPSLRHFNYDILRDELTIGCNEEWRWNPTISIIQDPRMIEKYKEDKAYLAADTIRVYFQGHPDRGDVEASDNIYHVPAGSRGTYQMWSCRLDVGLAYRANVGVAALNLADILGASPIYLLGYDCCEVEGHTHGHDRYGKTWIPSKARARQDRYDRWVRDYEELAPSIKAKVINLSTISAITCFPKQVYATVAGRIQPMGVEV
jgi:hypothetical protein